MSVECIQPWLAHRPRRGATVVDTIVLHASGTDDLDAMVAELKDKSLSYHYIIDRNGLPYKCVPYSAVAFHAGNSYGPHEATRGTSREQDMHHNFVELTSVNEYSIGLCMLTGASGAGAYTKEQVDACISLIKDLRASLKSLKFLTTHYWVSPGRVTDPMGLDVTQIAKATAMEIWQS